MEKYPIAIVETILQVPAIYLQVLAIYFQDFQKIVEYIPQLLQDKEGVLEYIPQLFENIAGVVEYIPQLLYYSITCALKVAGKVIFSKNKV